MVINWGSVLGLLLDAGLWLTEGCVSSLSVTCGRLGVVCRGWVNSDYLRQDGGCMQKSVYSVSYMRQGEKMSAKGLMNAVSYLRKVRSCLQEVSNLLSI